MRACSFELSLRIALHVPQRDLEVVKPEVGTCCFLLGFLLALLSIGPNCSRLRELVFYLCHLLCEMHHRHHMPSQVVRAVMACTGVLGVFVAVGDALSAPHLSWGASRRLTPSGSVIVSAWCHDPILWTSLIRSSSPHPTSAPNPRRSPTLWSHLQRVRRGKTPFHTSNENTSPKYLHHTLARPR